MGLCKRFKELSQDQRKQLADCSEMAKKLVQQIPTICQTTAGSGSYGSGKSSGFGSGFGLGSGFDSGKSSGYGSGYGSGKKPSMTDEQKRQAAQAACKAMEGMVCLLCVRTTRTHSLSLSLSLSLVEWIAKEGLLHSTSVVFHDFTLLIVPTHYLPCVLRRCHRLLR